MKIATDLTNRLDQIKPIQDNKQTISAKTGGAPGKFQNVLKQAVEEADRAIEDMRETDVKLASGQIDNLHTALIQAEQTAATVEFTTQLASKAVNAYNQVMNMQI